MAFQLFETNHESTVVQNMMASMLKVYESQKSVGSEGNSVMERVQVQIPDTPAKKTQRQRSSGISMLTGPTSSLEENKENPIAEELSAMDEEVVDYGGLMDTVLDSIGSLDLNKPAWEVEAEDKPVWEVEAGEFAYGYTAALLQTEDLAREDEEVLTFNLPSSQSSSNTQNPENHSCGFGSIDGSFMPVVQPGYATESMSQYNLKNQELVDGKYNIGDTNYIGSLKRKLHAATLQRPRKRLKRPKKKVYRPKVVRNLGRPIPRMEPKTPTKKNKRLKLKTPEMKKNVSLKKSSSTINLNHVRVPLDLESIVSEREFSSIDIEKHSKDGTRIISEKTVEHCITKCIDFDIGLNFLTQKKRTTMGKEWEVKDYSRIMEPNLQKIKKKKRMGRRRWDVDVWQKIANKFQANYLKRRRNKKRGAAPKIRQQEVRNIFNTEKKLSPCFITESGVLNIEESLIGMVSLLESDSFELFFKSIDILEDNINVVQKHQLNHGILVCYQENEKHGPHVELGIVASANGELGMVATTKGKGRRQEKLEKLEHGELAHPWKLQLQNEVKEGGKHDQNSEFWDKERQFFQGRINLFLTRMSIVQGNREFSEWDGSVMDSIVGVFLTQNVSDHLSSSAFISLAAAFPYQPSCNQELTYAKSEPSCEQSRIVKIEELVEGGISKSSCEQSNDQTYCEDINSGIHKLVGGNMVFDKESFTQEATTTMEYENQKSSDCEMVLAKQVELQQNFEGQDYYVDMPSDKPDCSIDIITENSLSYFNEEKQRGKKLKADAREINNEGAMVNGKPDWDYYRREHGKERKIRHMDSVDWQAVRQADVGDVAEAIKGRGQHRVIANRIKKFLNEVNEDHKEINLEWLRWAPAKLVRNYLTNIEGIGLKSVECVRLLALKQIAFPVDVNVGRIAIRLGWVPMQPLPEDVQIHVLEEMPVMDNIQKYLWPRLMKLEFEELYELHYQMITFGKVYCTKRKPNCHSCPMKNECKYYLSAYASSKYAALPKSMKKQGQKKTDVVICNNHLSSGYEPPDAASQSYLEDTTKLEYQIKDCEPIIEEPTSPGPSSPEPKYVERDIEDLFLDDPFKEFVTISPYINTFRGSDISTLVPFMTPEEAASIPARRLKEVDRLRTKHSVYVIKDQGPLFKELQLERRHPHDNSPYLFAMCTPDQMTKVSQSPQNRCSCKGSNDSSCDGEKTCFSCNSLSTQANTVQGTILIPCRTAMRGSFPLNGTYFQINEVFADHESSISPINVHRDLLWDQTRRDVYFGTSTSAILKGLSTYDVAMCFKEGFICVRAFNRETRRPEPLLERFHISTVKTAKKGKKKAEQKEDD